MAYRFWTKFAAWAKVRSAAAPSCLRSRHRLHTRPRTRPLTLTLTHTRTRTAPVQTHQAHGRRQGQAAAGVGKPLHQHAHARRRRPLGAQKAQAPRVPVDGVQHSPPSRRTTQPSGSQATLAVPLHKTPNNFISHCVRTNTFCRQYPRLACCSRGPHCHYAAMSHLQPVQHSAAAFEPSEKLLIAVKGVSAALPTSPVCPWCRCCAHFCVWLCVVVVCVCLYVCLCVFLARTYPVTSHCSVVSAGFACRCVAYRCTLTTCLPRSCLWLTCLYVFTFLAFLPRLQHVNNCLDGNSNSGNRDSRRRRPPRAKDAADVDERELRRSGRLPSQLMLPTATASPRALPPPAQVLCARLRIWHCAADVCARAGADETWCWRWPRPAARWPPRASRRVVVRTGAASPKPARVQGVSRPVHRVWRDV